MAKKKVKKVKKTKKVKKVVKSKKILKVKKVIQKAKSKEKALGRVEHFFDKISVAAISVKAPFKVGDVIHIKGHTTDFVQKVDSMQIEHQPVQKVKKGDDVGIKVKEFVRGHDKVYLSSEKELTAQPAKPAVVQQPIFSAAVEKPATKPASEGQGKADPYSNTKFLNF